MRDFSNCYTLYLYSSLFGSSGLLMQLAKLLSALLSVASLLHSYTPNSIN